VNLNPIVLIASQEIGEVRVAKQEQILGVEGEHAWWGSKKNKPPLDRIALDNRQPESFVEQVDEK